MDDLAEKGFLEDPPQVELVTMHHPELGAESDDGLVTYMAFRDTDEELVLKACEELHRRHARFLLGWCIKERYESFGDSAEDFVNDTFLRAYAKAESFVCTDPNRATDQVQAWLFRIAKNLFLDALRAEGRRPALRADNDELERLETPSVEPAQQPRVSSALAEAARAYLETLSPMEVEILTLTSEFWNPERGESLLDPDLRKGVCAKYGMTESSLRVRRKRLRDRGKLFIRQRISSKP